MKQTQTRSSQAGRWIGGLTILASLVLIAVVAFMDVGASGGTGPSHGVEGGPAPGTLVTGTVTGADGPLADLQVRVTLWPAQDTTVVGETVDLFSLEPVRTDDRGRYAVVLPLEDVPAEYLMSRRVVNFDVLLADAGVAPISTSARHPRTASWWVDVFGEGGDDPTTLDFDLDSMTATERSSGERGTWTLVER